MNLLGRSLESRGEAWNDWKTILSSLLPMLPGAIIFASNRILFILKFGLARYLCIMLSLKQKSVLSMDVFANSNLVIVSFLACNMENLIIHVKALYILAKWAAHRMN